MRWAAVAALVLGAVTAAGAADIEPLVRGWEQFFTLDWEVSERFGRPVVRGEISNQSPYTMTHVQLLVDALDGAGRVVAQQFAWGPRFLAPSDRRYFEIPLKERGHGYRVRVLAFDRLEVASHQSP